MTSTYCPHEFKTMVLTLSRDYFPNPEDAEDAAQEVFIKLMSLKSMPEDREAWAYTVTDNMLKDMKRKERARNRAEERAVQWLEDTVDHNDPLSVLEQEEAQMLLIENYVALPASMKELMELRYTQGMSYEEIATKLNISIGTVGSRIARAKEMLKV